MKLTISFEALHNAVSTMGAADRDFVLGVELSAIDPIDAELVTGIFIKPEDLEYTNNGLLTYKERQVLLYIQDHGSGIDTALANGASGKKYHVAYCRTLEDMHSKGRFERYVVKNDLSGDFLITGVDWETKTHKEGKTRLNVCKNCLKYLDYQGYQSQSKQSDVFREFSLETFFATYQAYFKYKPRRRAGEDKDGTYSSDWTTISKHYRASVLWRCENCGVDLKNNRCLLHTHHKNGVKSENSTSNLQALCIECHDQQPNHNLNVSVDNKQTLSRLRLKQK